LVKRAVVVVLAVFFEKSGAALVENSGKKYIPAEPDAWATRRGASQIRSFKLWHRQIMP
jgi:hypothetical protein